MRSGKRTATLFLGSFVWLAGSACAFAQSSWTPPIGIPMPSFGINERPPARPNPWTAERAGFYYVDSGPGCSDTRSFGYPGAARCTIPSSLSAGAYVELHGTYTQGVNFNWTGTAASPIFITGQDANTRPLITAGWDTNSGSYVILENLRFGPTSSTSSSGSVNISEGAHHIALRSVEVSGTTNGGGGIGVGNWSYSGSATANNIVLKNVSVHDLGVVVGATGDRDFHCVTVNGSVNSLWVVDSTFYGCEGDAIQIEAQHTRGIGKIHHVYFGRNVAHNNKQSGGWVKHATDVIFSQNEVYAIDVSTSGPGQCMGAQYNPQNVWFIFNKLHNCHIGIFIGSDDGSGDGADTYVVGNVIYSIHHPSDPADTYNSGAISARGEKNIWIVNNTIYDADGGVNSPPAGINFRIQNNVIAGRTATAGSELNLENAGSSTAAGNVFYRSGGIKIGWNGSSFTTPAFAGQCSGCVAADPRFMNAANANFALSAGSPAIDKGVASTVYSTFQSLYGLSINVDITGAPRMQGAAIDAGAYEFAGTVVAPPEAPAGFTAR